jgi:DNA topoisomerase-1
MKSLVIVESPTKAKTISKILGKNYLVKASMGHIRDLPETASDIPAKFKQFKWSRVGIDVENDFSPIYVVGSKKRKVVSDLKKDLLNSDELILATDEDREGEAISWHLLEVLKPKMEVKRIVFHEITDEAINDALKNPRKINMKIVEAQETRRFLDRLFGYSISPILWKKIKFGLSAGRVQSVALKIVVEREIERINFIRSKYSTISGFFSENSKNETFETNLIEFDGKKIAESTDFDSTNGEIFSNIKNNLLLIQPLNVEQISNSLKNDSYIVSNIIKKSQKRLPPPPFITSSLQIEANRKLGFSSKQTMQVAQKLYEQGFITYMRTDSVTLSSQALNGIKKKIISDFGDKYWAGYFRKYKNKSKNAQEAHEAIRPAGSNFKTGLALNLEGEQLSLYNLIWNRTIGSQMSEAKLDVTTIEIKGKINNSVFKASGNVLQFDGFLKLYGRKMEDVSILPELTVNQSVLLSDLKSDQHETKPPARFNDASLVKKLEAEGVGRPSTYASIINTITSRGYTEKIDGQLIPTFTAFSVYNFLNNGYHNLIDLKFTAEMEDSLDEIEKGKLEWKPYLSSFYFGKNGLLEKVTQDSKIKESKDLNIISLPNISSNYKILMGAYGPYVIKFDDKMQEVAKATLPNDCFPGEITNADIEKILDAKVVSDKPILIRDDSEVFIKTGRFGTYLQEVKKGGEIKNISLPKFLSVKELSTVVINKLLDFPYLLGEYNGNEIRVGYGRFGGYIVYNSKYSSIGDEKLFTISLAEAIELIENPKVKRGGGYSKKKVIKDFGKIDRKNLQILDGKYGKYLKWGSKNYTIDKGIDIENLNIEMIKSKIINI